MPRMRLSPTDTAVLDALLPGRAHPVLVSAISETGFERFLDDFERAAPRHLWRAFRIGLFTAAWVAPVLVRRVPPLTRPREAGPDRAPPPVATGSMPQQRQPPSGPYAAD